MDLPQRKNIRKYWYDYNNSWSYFITICTKHREHYFWEIQDRKMISNDLWKYVWDCRNNIPNHFSFVEIGEFICMPDHIHGILIIKSGRDANTARPVDHCDIQWFEDRTAHDAVPTWIHGPQYGSLWYIINQYKWSITKFAHQNSIPFARQSRFYDHVISDEIEYYCIAQYIQNNPKNR